MKFKLHQAWPCWLVLAAFISACHTLDTPTSPPPISWHTTQSPPFPDEWPPTTSTVWVRYTFAYGSNPSALADGAYVTLPLTRTELRERGASAITTTLRTGLESAGIQGVTPLDAQSRAALETAPRVAAFGLQFIAAPDPEAANTRELREFYRTWLKFNGAFAKWIQPDHAAFFDWLNRAP